MQTYERQGKFRLLQFLTGFDDSGMGTISKALYLLDHFSQSTPEIGLSEFQRLSDLNKATVYRHLVELEKTGFVEQNPNTRKYRLGAAILRLASVRERTFPMRSVVEHHVDKLSARFKELVHASLVQGSFMSPLYFKDYGDGGTRVYFNEAQLLPTHATASGIAALAFGSPSVLKATTSKELQRFTQNTIVDSDILKQRAAEVRSIGFSECDQCFEAEIHSIAVPFFSDGIFAKGAIAIAVPTTRMNDDAKHQFIRALWTTANDITTELGGQIPSEVKSVWKLGK